MTSFGDTHHNPRNSPAAASLTAATDACCARFVRGRATSRVVLVVGTLALVGACSDPDTAPANDAGAPIDSGTFDMDAARPSDAGARTDALGGDATVAVDATTLDASTPSADAGEPCPTVRPCEARARDAMGACVSAGARRLGALCGTARGPCDWYDICDGESLDCMDWVLPLGAPCPGGGCDGRGSCVTFGWHDAGLAPDGGCAATAGSSCGSSSPCRGSFVDCTGACGAVQDAPAGSPCPGGTCIGGSCDVGESSGGPCSTGNPCEIGRLRLAGGAPSCIPIAPVDSALELVCRSSSSECDVAERCDGESVACPADGFAAAGTACTGGACDGAGACVTP